MATGKISTIPKDYSTALPSQEKSLRMAGYSRTAGAFKMVTPSMSIDGSYKTGLDEFAPHILKIRDEKIRGIEQERIKKERERLEKALNLKLDPRSPYYNFSTNIKEARIPYKVEFVSLKDGDNIFNLDRPIEAVTFAWLSVHNDIAPSLAAYNAGHVPAEVQFYVNNEDYESAITYSNKKRLNDAITTLNSLSIDKRKKIAALSDLPVGETTKEETVYNMVDEFLKKPQIIHAISSDPLTVFETYASLNNDTLEVAALVDQAFKHQLYRLKAGKVFEGQQLMWESKEALIDFLLDTNNQSDRLELEKKLKIKKEAQL